MRVPGGKGLLAWRNWKRWHVIAGTACVAAVLVLVTVLVPDRPSLPANAGTVARVRLMTGEQFANTIAYLFGPDIKVGSAFAPLQRTDGLLALGAASVGVTSGQIQQFQRVSASIAAQVMDAGNPQRHVASHRDSLVPCKPAAEKAPDDECAEQFIRRTGRLLFRRPLSEDKVKELVSEAHDAAVTLKDFYRGLSSVLEGMLINPRVLLIEDTTEPDPDHPGFRRLDAYALAQRLSFFLWNSAPDDALLDAAQSGELQTPEGRERIVDMMLQSPRLETGLRAFFDDMFAFDDFDTLSKDAVAYPAITGATLQDAREQTLRTVIDHLLVKNADYRDLFTTRETFMSPALGAVYEVPAIPGWTPYEFPADSGRDGILTHISFLALHAHPARSSPTKRGKALRELFLCQVVPAPPPNVDFSAVENPDANLHTARERLEVHRKNPSCAGCHKITDPIGLALENFDGAGQYRQTENGAPIDVSGSLDGKPFTTVAQLGTLLRDNPAVPKCLVRRLYTYATGGPLPTPNDAVVKYLDERFSARGYHVIDLLREIASSEAFSRIVDSPAPLPQTKLASS